MYPILTNIGPFVIHSYGLMVALAYVAGIATTLYFAKKAKIQPELIFDLALWLIVSGIIGARLFYVIGQWDLYRSNLLEIVMVQKGGLVILGGFLFNLAAVYYFAKQKKLNLLRLFDVIAPGAALGIAIGRIGCFLNGCCFGLPTNLFWGINFPFGALAHSYYPTERLHPTQLYSIFLMLLVFVVVTFIIYPRKKYDGQVFYWWLIMFAVARFVVEFFRYSPMHWLMLTPSQWIVILLFVYGTAGLIKAKK